LKKQAVFEYMGVILLGLVILNLMIHFHQIGAKTRSEFEYFPAIMNSFLAIFFGILIEWKRFKAIFTGNLSVNWLLLPSLVLLIAGLIPVMCYLYVFGLTSPYGIKVLGWIVDPFRYTNSRIPINVLSGILIVRSLTNGKV